MHWQKRGLIFTPDHNMDWMVSYAQMPTIDVMGQDALRVYFSTRDAQTRSSTGYVDVDAEEPRRILALSDEPVLPLGELGTFDDSGVMISCIVENGDRKYLYYIGWNPQITVSYRLAIGLAISEDGGETYTRYAKGPICDRDEQDPFFVTTPWVMIDNGLWRMWYTSCTGWQMIDGKPEPAYHVKYAESNDGIHWRRTGVVCIDYDEFTGAIARPSVFVEDGLYKMLYSYRSTRGYRTDPAQAYRMGYAESSDGITWQRKDDEAGITRSKTGWDSQMIAYGAVYPLNGQLLLFYNGNGFGRSGLGYAIRADE